MRQFFWLVVAFPAWTLAIKSSKIRVYVVLSSERLVPTHVPDDYGKIKVKGEIVALSPQHIAIRRHDPHAGEIVVHFPRVGFLVLSA
jgi:hypothetical protein